MNPDPRLESPELPFGEKYRAALESLQLRENLLRFQRAWRNDRDAAFERDNIDFEAMRGALRAAKDEVIDHLPEYLEQFKSAAQAAGAIVYEAETADDLNRYVLDLARRKGHPEGHPSLRRGTRLIVKSKIMVSEETDLNHYLAERGIEAIETDLGEWIVQLAHERPSHMVMPAIHKNALEVGDLLSRAVGREISRSNVAEQVLVARKELRAAFLRAGMGLSGANALVAESGTVMMVTNEGNGELVTSLPPVHVVLAGIEKLVPTFADAITQLRLLPRSATAQRLTTYVTWLTGPASPNKEMHIILLNNGRTAMRENPLFRDALRCIRCAACANVCPPYAVVGGHVFGYIYSGAIGLVNTPFHHGLEADAGPQSLCVSCNACQTVCPVDIPLPRQILDVRAMEAEARGLPLLKRLGLILWRHPTMTDFALRVAALLQWPLTRGGPYLRLPPPILAVGPLRRLTGWRSPPALASKPFRDRWTAVSRKPVPALDSAASGVRVAYFVQCLTDRLYPPMGEAAVAVLRSCGAEVTCPRAQHCCGLPAIDSGDKASACIMARQTIEILEAAGADYVVSGAASCVAAIVHDYPHLFADDPLWLARAERLAAKTLDLVSFVRDVARLPPDSLAHRENSEPITYHFFCQSANVLKLGDRPYRVLRELCALEVRDLPEAAVCCGFGGSVSFERPDMARHILQRKLEIVDSTGARVLVSDNPGCIMHLRGGADATSRNLRVLHIAEVLAEGLPPA